MGGLARAVTVLPNWAALPEMPVRPRDNEWAHATTSYAEMILYVRHFRPEA